MLLLNEHGLQLLHTLCILWLADFTGEAAVHHKVEPDRSILLVRLLIWHLIVIVVGSKTRWVVLGLVDFLGDSVWVCTDHGEYLGVQKSWLGGWLENVF